MRTIPQSKKIQRYLFLFVLALLVLISGARLVSSDEVSMYLTVESIVTHGSLAIPFENAPNSISVGGKSYTWYEAGNIIAGIPLYILGSAVSAILPLPETYQSLIPRVAVSYTSTFIGAWIAVLFFIMCHRFGLPLRLSIVMSLILVFSTFLLPYFKMYLREPILTLCLLGGIIYLIPDSNNNRKNRSLLIAGIFIGYGILTKLAFVVNLIPIVVYLFLSSSQQKQNFQTRLKEALIFMIPIILIGFVGTGLYNYLRFGNSFNSGYAGGTSFTTPFYVGLFGLLLSPGKGLIWFAPILMLLIPAQKFFRTRFPHEMYLIAGLFILNLLLSSMYVAWGGDGSWGPRYLAPFLPLLLLPIGFYLEHGSTVLKRMAILLTLIGVIIQIGGISIYAGAYLREIGEYPYKRGFEEPEFLYKAHFIPNYSPAIGHWRMLTRNASEHLDGKYPTLEISNQLGDKRLPIAQEDQSKLLHTLDYWFTYALYANVPKNIILTLLVVLVGLCGMTGFLLRRALLSNTIQ